MNFHAGLLIYLTVLSTTRAFRVDVHGRQRTVAEPRFTRRANITGTQLKDTANIGYYANVSLGGRIFQLLVDTGRCV
jgi:hypothetical protein